MKKLAIIINSFIGIIILWSLFREGISSQSDTLINIIRLLALFIFGINLLAIIKPEKLILIKTALGSSVILIVLGALGLFSAVTSNMQGSVSLGVIVLFICLVPGVLNIQVHRKTIKSIS